MKANYYHAHIYYTLTEFDSIESIRKKIIEHFQMRVRVSRRIDYPIGPHPKPMFEVDFRREDLKELTAFFEQEGKGHSILIHPVIEDELYAHTDGAIWLGEKLVLDLSILK